MPNIVVHQGALGDLLISLPALRLLRKKIGDFTLAANPDTAMFLKRTGEVASVLPITASGFHQLYSGAIPAMLQYFDLFWWFTRRRGLVPDILLRPDYKPDCRVIFTVYEGVDPLHCARFQFQQMAKNLGAEGEAFEEFLAPLDLTGLMKESGMSPGPDMEGEHQAFAFNMAIHPGSGSKKKNWPLNRFMEVADKVLAADKARVLFLLGPADDDLREPLLEYVTSKDGMAVLMDRAPLEQVALMLRLSRTYLGNDSGISHLAAWCGVESTVLFGPTDPKIWAPPHSWVKVLSSPERCSPCGDSYRDCESPVCMEAIPV